VEEDLPVEDGGRRGRGRHLFSPQVGGVEVALVCGKVVVDGEAALSEKHVRGVGPISLYRQNKR